MLKVIFPFIPLLLLSFSLSQSLQAAPCSSQDSVTREVDEVVVGAERLDLLLPIIERKSIGIVSNHTGRVGKEGTLLPDTLLTLGQKVVRLFSPEHGFRGTADAGAKVSNMLDNKTGLPVVSLYGDKKKPNKEHLKDIEILLFDLQDVGTRFYTYISTLHYVMEAAAEQKIPVVVLDRPNPNDFIDGPLLSSSCRSFIGMHPIPLLHGLTVGELALMINGEQWLSPKGLQCDLTIIPMKGWKHGDSYSLPVAPSPNLKSDDAIRLYPSLCLFEATIMSVGRGTDNPFTCIGYPEKKMGDYSFTPRSQVGASTPKHKGKRCYGEDFSTHSEIEGLNLYPLLKYYKKARSLGYTLINRKRTFDLLAGTASLREQLDKGWSEKQIRASWEKDLAKYRTLHAQYLIYDGKYGPPPCNNLNRSML
ncbi:exo-beta-N-acetylmuramidase NamZ family protein [Porphyromonas circumdentaria]|uniref:exo-beta-N-acetylmuramidase NamZ family protein n=1 Tax=Porphyromonas circumdentaria TaxID=29524 RepID=UPI0026DD23FE|nr:DUF1343 domain-containing protein [Porphyromonas circumdentaria]MDO4722771.1 DUF1343 domain-containing protein [Porphyromonas circumdentaria]